MASAVVYQRKRALIIGINSYPSDSLKYCVNDATDLKTTLEGGGFSVLLGIDCNLGEFYDIIDEFVSEIQRTDLVLVYFAGHGKQNDNENYLLPSDYDYDYRGSERDYIVNRAINVQYIMKKIDDKRCSITVLIFDCCRKFMKDRAPGMQGLSTISAPSHTLVAFSCAPGETVLDETRNGRNSIFTGSFLEHIATPNTHIEDIFMDVARDVQSKTDGFQRPFRSTDLTEKVYLITDNVSAGEERPTSALHRRQRDNDTVEIEEQSVGTETWSKDEYTGKLRWEPERYSTGIV